MQASLLGAFDEGSVREPTFPVEAGALKKGGFIVIKERPCKICEIDASCPGKHGSAKVSITGKDIFTGKKMTHLSPGHSNVDVPFVDRVELLVLAVIDADGADGTASLDAREECGAARKVGCVPADMRSTDELEADVRERLARGDDVFVSVVRVCGEQGVAGVRSAHDGGKAARRFRGATTPAEAIDVTGAEAPLSKKALSKKAQRALKKQEKKALESK